MKYALIGQAFMIPSYAFIVAAILNSQDMTTFLMLMGMSLACTVVGVVTGIRLANRMYPE